MDDAVRVREGDRLANALECAKPLGERVRAACVLVQTNAVDELHDVEDAPIGERARVVDGHDRGMLEPRPARP